VDGPALELEPERGFPFLGAACEVWHGWAVAVTGRPAQGLAELERGLRRFRGSGALTGWGVMVGLRIEAMLLAGRPVAAVRAVLDDGVAEVERQGELFVLPYLALAEARAAAAEEAPPAEVEAHLDRAVGLAEQMGIAPVAGLAAELRARLAAEGQPRGGAASQRSASR